MKIFDDWNQEKKEIHLHSQEKKYVNIREIWFTKMGQNIGYEENGKDRFLRPVLVVKKIGSLFLTVALTSKGKENDFYKKLKTARFNEQNIKHKDSSFIILSQVRVMDKKRFTEKMGVLAKDEFEELKEKLKTFLF